MILAQCIDEVEKYDVVNTESGADYENPYKELLESLCYSDCSGNGICDKGKLCYTCDNGNLHVVHSDSFIAQVDKSLN